MLSAGIVCDRKEIVKLETLAHGSSLLLLGLVMASEKLLYVLVPGRWLHKRDLV